MDLQSILKSVQNWLVIPKNLHPLASYYPKSKETFYRLQIVIEVTLAEGKVLKGSSSADSVALAYIKNQRKKKFIFIIGTGTHLDQETAKSRAISHPALQVIIFGEVFDV